MAKSLIVVRAIGLEKIKRDLKSFPRKSAIVYGAAVKQAGTELLNTTTRLPPVSARKTGWDKKGMPTDQGTLRQSIKMRQIGLFAVGVFPGVEYGGDVHEGVPGQRPPAKARPFFQWALDDFGAQKRIDAIFLRASALVP